MKKKRYCPYTATSKDNEVFSDHNEIIFKLNIEVFLKEQGMIQKNKVCNITEMGYETSPY